MLTEIQIKNAKPREKPYRLYDERGMFFEVRPAALKQWLGIDDFLIPNNSVLQQLESQIASSSKFKM